MIVGLTGGIGSGKSTVAAMLAERGACVVDTDAVAREVVAPPSPVLESIRAAFGDGIMAADGTLDRAALARLVFSDEKKLAQLNRLTHPAILKRALATIAMLPKDALVIVVVPLLYESNFERNCHSVIAVTASEDTRRRRLHERDGLTDSDIQARMRAQLDASEYERRGAFILPNDGDREELRLAVDQVWKRLRVGDGHSERALPNAGPPV
ncbi:MAG: dephospho-CoA kinase [Candidatus Eremiobacter antarcticus]|nr:dephospho-CoA kinase [Candidatus Eremiobacteraeota bacterium]MBC5808328.1 dephospho-CoA kinase [Candidatus Eremiobacteraeota bacterium]PZR63696.1 MAG: dephospho-CoA kinase [Candidatus Eremiobacter sp. RRmetagenome_bin22]